jgi:hypothetical protein
MTPQADLGAPYVYRAFGLSLASDVELPELRPADGGPPDVQVRFTAPPNPADAPVAQLSARVWAGPGRFVMDVPDCARIDVRDGRTVWVEAAASAAPGDIRAYLLGSAMGALLHQRGLLPLHASAVEVRGAAVAFAGSSGAGKSTLALALQARGYPLLGDDICAVEDGRRAWPGVTRMKLWRQSLAHAAIDPAGLAPVLERLDKFQLPARRLADDHAHDLRGLYVLPGAGEPSALARLTGASAVKAVMDHTFRGQLVAPMGCTAAHLQACLELARAVPVWRLPRAWDLSLLQATIKELEAHWRHTMRFDSAQWSGDSRRGLRRARNRNV